MISVIAAVANNRAIGVGNKLIYHLPNDLRRFKQLTTNHTIIMGRRTFESLPNGALPNRRNIVLSHNTITLPNVEVYPSLNSALAACNPNEEIFIIGGASVYEQAMPLTERLYITEVDDTPTNADAFFPDYSGWFPMEREAHQPDERHPFSYVFVTYTRRGR